MARLPHRFDIFLPKLYRSIKTGELLKFEEILGGPLGYVFNNSVIFQDAGVQIVDNESEEILNAEKEMIANLKESTPVLKPVK